MTVRLLGVFIRRESQRCVRQVCLPNTAALQDAMAHIRALQRIANAQPRPTGADHDCSDGIRVASLIVKLVRPKEC